MATPHFILKDKKSENDTLIFLLYRFANERLKYSTTLTINPGQWDEKSQRVRISDVTDKPTLKKLQKINNTLNEYVSMINKIKEIWDYQKIELTPEILRDELDREFKIEKETRPKITFLQFVDDYLKKARFAQNSNPPRNVSQETNRKYEIAYKHITSFVNQERKGKLEFKDINKTFYDDFIGFLRKEKKQANNTVGKNISIMLMFARAAQVAGFIKDATILKGLKVFKEPVYNIYLTEEELDTIFNHDFTNSPSLDRMRDFFIIGCRTALRFSDFTRIKKEHFFVADGAELLRIRTIKTRQEVIIPVHWQVKAILEKHDYELPRPISNQKSNKYLKTIGQLCGLNQTIIKSKTKGGKYEEKVYEKWQMISTHTGRRTGATLLYKAGMPAISIMGITGHTDEASFLKYIKLDKQEHAVFMAKHDYFKKPTETPASPTDGNI